MVLLCGSGCGPAPHFELGLDWSLAVEPSGAPNSSPARLLVDGSKLVNAATGAQVQLRGVNVCSFEFDRLGANWKVDSAQVSQLLVRLADPLHWHANVVRMPLNQQWF